MTRRADSSAGTRQRIVEATAALHAEKGVAATTYREISERADVGLGTVYHHFPTYDDVIIACGHHTLASAQPPTTDSFAHLKSAGERFRVLVAELFAFYQRLPSLGRVLSERERFAPLQDFFRLASENRRALVAAAFRGSRASARLRAVAFAMLDFSVYESLLASGLNHAAAVEEVTNLLLSRLRTKRN